MSGRTVSPRWWSMFTVFMMALALLGMIPGAALAQGSSSTRVYTNPLPITIPGGGLVESCPDPSIIRGQQPGDYYWYMYCTSNPLNDQDRQRNGAYNTHLISIHKSLDLVHWTYIGDALSALPRWLPQTADMWAPDIQFFNGRYYLYYAASNTNLPGGGSAIGVLTAHTSTGPWTDSGGPVVEPQVEPDPAPGCQPRMSPASGSWRWTIDPSVIEFQGQRYIYYGSFCGGISVRRLSADGLHSDPASQEEVAIAHRYDGFYIVKYSNYLYMFISATGCCNGPLTGYTVFVGRSQSPFGPFVDKQGVSLMAGRVGGTPVLSMNGNRWVGPGHNAMLTDFNGQDWLLYHAIDQEHPYFADAVGFVDKRPVLLDALDWLDGWPTVRGGRWASDQGDKPQPAPAAQKGDERQYKLQLVQPDELGAKLGWLSDEFNAATLGAQWSWIRRPASDAYGLENGAFRFDTQDADLWKDYNNASVLTEPAPNGNYAVETRVKLNLPAEGRWDKSVQAGLVIYRDDDNYIKLTHVSIWETRQTEFAKELSPVPADYPRYGNTVVGPPGATTWLRIVKRTHGDKELYTAYTSNNGVDWVRGGVWTHQLGNNARIGLVSMGGPGFVAKFDYVRVYTVR